MEDFPQQAQEIISYDKVKKMYPTLFNHDVKAEHALIRMKAIREEFISMAVFMMEILPEGRPKSIAFTHLEESRMRSIQAISVEAGTLQEEGP